MQGESVQRFPVPPGLLGTGGGEIRAIARDDQNVLWLSANGTLLRLLDGQLQREATPPVRSPAAGPSEQVGQLGKVRSIARDADGTLWVGSGDGLLRRRQGRWRLFGRDEGVERTDLFQVVPDDHGYLWVGVNHGLLRFAKAELEAVDRGQRKLAAPVSIELLDQRREVRVTRTRQPGVWKNRAGRLRFASSRGVVSIDPRRVPMNTLPPPVRIERALVDGRPARRGEANRFPPGSGAMEFHFAAITLLDPRRAQHRYRLEGFDRDWVDAGTRRAAYYTNLGPGHYRFRVQGSNADGVWNDTGDALELALAPHFYQTIWFWGLAAAAALGLALSLHRSRVARLRAFYAATLAERARVARELHDSLLQGMAAALMHLRGVRKRFAADKAAAPAETVARELKEIEQLVSDNIEETRQFVWDLRDASQTAKGNGAARRRRPPGPGADRADQQAGAARIAGGPGGGGGRSPAPAPARAARAAAHRPRGGGERRPARAGPPPGDAPALRPVGAVAVGARRRARLRSPRGGRGQAGTFRPARHARARRPPGPVRHRERDWTGDHDHRQRCSQGPARCLKRRRSGSWWWTITRSSGSACGP